MNERRKEYRLNYTHVNLFRAVPSYTRNERTRAVKEKEKGKYKKLLIQHTHWQTTLSAKVILHIRKKKQLSCY